MVVAGIDGGAGGGFHGLPSIGGGNELHFLTVHHPVVHGGDGEDALDGLSGFVAGFDSLLVVACYNDCSA